MKVTKAHVELCKRINELQESSYRTGTTIGTNPEGEPVEWGVYTHLADFAYNGAQTPRTVCSFTAHLAHLISVTTGSWSTDDTRSALVTAISEEAAGYIAPHSVAQYLRLLEQACERHNLQAPEGLAELREELQREAGVETPEKLWS